MTQMNIIIILFESKNYDVNECSQFTKNINSIDGSVNKQNNNLRN